MEETYKKYFVEAVSRTTKFQMNTPLNELFGIGSNSEKYATHENQTSIGLHISKSLNGFSSEETTAKFIKYCYLSKPLIDEYLGIKTILTLGYVIDKGNEIFKFGDNDILNMMNQSPEKYQNKKAGVHVWLTLPSFEICDLTYIESKNATPNNPFIKENGFDFIFNTLENIFYKQQIEYVPMLIGEDSLFKLGLIENETFASDNIEY